MRCCSIPNGRCRSGGSCSKIGEALCRCGGMVDTGDLKSPDPLSGHAGSIPAGGTMWTSTYSMKERVNAIRSFKKLLKMMQPFVTDFPGLMLKTKKFPGSSLSAIEMWGNWLLCAYLRRYFSSEITFADDGNGDGTVFNRKTQEGFRTEHVCALDNPNAREILPLGDQRIIEKINLKINKNYSDADKLALVVFFDGAMKWYRNKIREAIKGKSKFGIIYLIGLLTKDERGLMYTLTELHENTSFTFKIHINSDFTHWSVSKLEEDKLE